METTPVTKCRCSGRCQSYFILTVLLWAVPNQATAMLSSLAHRKETGTMHHEVVDQEMLCFWAMESMTEGSTKSMYHEFKLQ
eukprot:4539052-Amphidinium_carterae.1